jgi:hypothetical protein
VRGVWSILAVAALGACLAYAMVRHYHVDTPAIYVRGAWIVVENQTDSPWKDVTVTINAYYHGLSPALAPGGRLEAPLTNFVTGLGQRFDTSREHVTHVDVHAIDALGRPVVLEWDENGGK